MKNIKELFIRYKELITYAVFGVATTVVNFIVLTVFNLILGERLYLISNAIAWLVAASFAYVTNKLWVFESKSWQSKVVMKELLPFYSARLFSLLIEEAGLFLFVDLLGWGEYAFSLGFIGIDYSISGLLPAKAILAVVVVVLNYVFSKLVVFKKKTDSNE